MILPYLVRLLCLSFASFFLVHTVLTLAASIGAPAAIRLAERFRPRVAVRFLFALRLFPSVVAGFVVFGLCVPSYIWFEPEAAVEQVGFACFAAALLGAAICAASIHRASQAIAGSVRYTRHCKQNGSEIRVSGESSPALVIEEDVPVLALAGAIRPRLVISRGVMRALSAEQFDAALRHERAHRISRDNLKRLLLLLAPGAFLFSRRFTSLEQNWARFSEWAADDQAVEGDSLRALWLAAALVRVARMGACPQQPFLLSSLMASDRDLSARVKRLLAAEPLGEKSLGQKRALMGGAALLAAVSLATLILLPATLPSVHRILEQLVR
jgi:Zn-dependent protease with chaperone function